ncbi:hypothetical protein Prudu_013277 [Prunus dulcis]|uniref:Uncharacterized protein n=1 Tax=Prunus dulcis TaxID=3755 RepID=A0A4Y1RFG8_PRUDU|nr:hypothetical protein Prudu_013277 [Prunus dulcis]
MDSHCNPSTIELESPPLTISFICYLSVRLLLKLFEEVEGFGLWFWTEDHLRKMIDEFEKIKQQLVSFGNSTILDHSPYPTGVEDHDYQTQNYKRHIETQS